MSSKTTFFQKDQSYKTLHKILSDRYGAETTTAIFTFAASELTKLLSEYPDIPKGEQKHTHPYIFPRVAMFRAMKRELGDAAIPVMDELILMEGTKVGNLMKRITALPLMEKVFLKAFSVVAKKQFGEKNGFQQSFYPSSKGTVKFDITQCPYCKYCTLCECPELIHTFCDSDAYCFGNLSKITFTREQTLEKYDKCNFTLTIDK